MNDHEMTELLSALRAVEFPTLGHFLEEGFTTPRIRRHGGTERMVGIASTVLIPDSDAVAVNRAILRLQVGDVLVIDMGEGCTHASVGAVTAAAARAAGAAGILVNGPVTDLDELDASHSGRSALPVYASGSSCLTTKRRDSGLARYGEPVTIDGVRIRPGDIVVGDRNGVVAAPAEAFRRVIHDALESDAAEPELLAQIRSGKPLDQLLFLGE